MIALLPLRHSLRAPFFLRPKLPTIHCYGDEYLGLSEKEMQPVQEWLLAKMLHVDSCKEIHLCWYDSEDPWPSLACPGIAKELLEGLKKQQPVFGICQGTSLWSLPEGYSWRMLSEHSSVKIYQLEAKKE